MDKRKFQMKIEHCHSCTFKICTFLFTRVIKTVKKPLNLIKDLFFKHFRWESEVTIDKIKPVNKTSSDKYLCLIKVLFLDHLEFLRSREDNI